jgi:predicted nuclease with RNAse H fold/dephospho-CoA kinase
MRESERILKRRGINVYPCLIPSMQRLTDRGMRLAATLRAQGIATIECYPGAAQDIMGIPRKGAGKEWLQLGLTEFGISGPFKTGNLTHDELDAITCSLVGSFHLAGYTEALGGMGEEPMIVPDLETSDSLVVGISGEIAAGKTTAAKYLEQQGFGYTRISLVIDEVLRERGELPSRERHQEVGWELHREKGQAWLCRRAIELVPPDTQRIVIDGLRWVDDVRYMRERFGGRFVHIHLTAPVETRESRYAGLSKDVSFDEASRHPVEQGIGETRALADMIFVNDEDIATLNHHFEQLLTSRANAD